MSTNYINIGTIHNDHHREMTVNVPAGTKVSDIVQSFFHDQPVEDVTETPETELFKYIHPSVTDDEERLKIHKEVVNLVRNFPLSEICDHLRQLKKDTKVYLNIKPEAMFEELHRLGMPDENTPGYTYKNFTNYYGVGK